MPQTKEPLVFGDPEQPLTVGVFVHWLEQQFDPHVEHDVCQSKKIDVINVALIGNGDQKTGIKHKVDEMWAVSQRLDTALNMARLAWIAFAGLLGTIATVAVIGHNVGWW